MNVDGRPDLVVTASHHFDNTADPSVWGVYVFLYDSSNNSFDFDSYQSSIHPVRGLLIADIDNQDGPDVIAVPDHINPNGSASMFSYFLNDGTGQLLPEATAAVGDSGEFSPNDAVAGFFDKVPGGPSYPDVVTSRPADAEAVLLTNNAGALSGSAITACTSNTYWDYGTGRFTLGDLSEDVAAIGYGGIVYVLHNDSLGGFSGNCASDPNDIYLDASDYCGCDQSPASSRAFALTTGDVNGGTKIDIVATDTCENVRLLLGRGDDTFAYNCYDYATGGDTLVQVVVTDLNLDGFGDIVTVSHGSAPGQGGLNILLNKMIAAIGP